MKQELQTQPVYPPTCQTATQTYLPGTVWYPMTTTTPDDNRESQSVHLPVIYRPACPRTSWYLWTVNKSRDPKHSETLPNRIPGEHIMIYSLHPPQIRVTSLAFNQPTEDYVASCTLASSHCGHSPCYQKTTLQTSNTTEGLLLRSEIALIHSLAGDISDIPLIQQHRIFPGLNLKQHSAGPQPDK